MGKATPLACNLEALTSTERDHREALLARLKSAIRGTTLLVDGMEIDIGYDAIREKSINRFIELEGHCCPFLKFEKFPLTKGVTVRITGPPGAGDFLVSQFGSP